MKEELSVESGLQGQAWRPSVGEDETEPKVVKPSTVIADVDFKKGAIGTARFVQKNPTRSKDMTKYEILLGFRLEILDESGNVIHRFPVEARAEEILGDIKDGDIILVFGKINKKNIIEADSLKNETTNSKIELINSSFVKEAGRGIFGGILGIIAFVIFVVGFFGSILTLIDNVTLGIIGLIATFAILGLLNAIGRRI